jgi:hypothetical protein
MKEKHIKKYSHFNLQVDDDCNALGDGWSSFSQCGLPLAWVIQLMQHVCTLDVRLGAIVVADDKHDIMHVTSIDVDDQFRKTYRDRIQMIFDDFFPWINSPGSPMPANLPFSEAVPDRETWEYNCALKRALLRYIGVDALPPVDDLLSAPAHLWNTNRGKGDRETKIARDSRAKINHCGALSYVITNRIVSNFVSTIHTLSNIIRNADVYRENMMQLLHHQFLHSSLSRRARSIYRHCQRRGG